VQGVPALLARGVMCTKKGSFKLRYDARARLLELWSQGHWHLRRTHWCGKHQAFHLTRSPPPGGKNWLYKD
jgi:hypothetical protein